MVLVIKNLPANSGDMRDTCLIPGSGRSPGEGNGHPLQYSHLENPMDRGAWRATGNRYSPEDYRHTAQPTPWPQTIDLQNGKKMNVSCFKLKIEKGNYYT